MINAFDLMQERGFVKQVTDADAVRQALERPVVAYCGFDPTAKSFHCGSLVPIMGLANLQRCGHPVIAIMGSGTTLVGDPSGKTEMRQMLDRETIAEHGVVLREQLGRYLDIEQALVLDNADWLCDLNYIDFLREVGRHFSVNRMLAAEAYRMRMEQGLSFLEFNYQILQAYDFYVLHRHHGCTLQIGGDDQWGNMLAGVDLIRRIGASKGETSQAHCLTFPLLETAGGAKMGKTAGGAVWLDARLTPPYDFYQYWVNSDDRDVQGFLAYFTMLPMDEIRGVVGLEGAELNAAKTVLAYEVTAMTHGHEEARRCKEAAMGAFGSYDIPGDLLSSSSVPRKAKGGLGKVPATGISEQRLGEGIPLCALLAEVGLCRSKGEARRLIQQGGCHVNGEKASEIFMPVTLDLLEDGIILLRAGKKRYHRVVVGNIE